MSKAFIILVLLSVFFSEVGYFFYYSYEQGIIKKEIKKTLVSQMGEEFLEQIDYTINEENIRWEEEGKEFYFKGQMYDVVRISKRNGHTYLHCFNDKKETALKQTVNTLAQENSSKPSSEKNKHILKLKITEYLLVDNSNDISLLSKAKEHYFTFDENCFFIFTEKSGPPPRI